jgi:hypothetical protein
MKLSYLGLKHIFGQQVRPSTAPKGPHSQPSQIVPGHDVQVYTEWGTWSPCSRCGKAGKRVRSGICMVKLLQDGFLETNPINVTDKLLDETENPKTTTEMTEIKPSTQTARGNIQTVKQKTTKIMRLFKKGIPCRSSLLPSELQSIPKISARKSEIMVALCKVRMSIILFHD